MAAEAGRRNHLVLLPEYSRAGVFLHQKNKFFIISAGRRWFSQLPLAQPAENHPDQREAEHRVGTDGFHAGDPLQIHGERISDLILDQPRRAAEN